MAVGALMLVVIGQCGNQLVSASDVPAATESDAVHPRPSPSAHRPDAPGGDAGYGEHLDGDRDGVACE
ncbi:excalibur calcium-binding domain-containing protein [Nocardioides sediminis]|uniref:excalibur calcium-binding domain-containing protein n=1 Tax=Nocardioides sediminis TaxID=433648 RepID=UPI00131ED315|nr:excalibur calcium-binding domain-containing protein [Nocardioides sediminis]